MSVQIPSSIQQYFDADGRLTPDGLVFFTQIAQEARKVPGLETRIADLATSIAALEARIAALEAFHP